MNKNLLEPTAIIDDGDWNSNDWPSEREIEQSKAISLKRIADSLAHIEAVTCNPLVTINEHPQA